MEESYENLLINLWKTSWKFLQDSLDKFLKEYLFISDKFYAKFFERFLREISMQSKKKSCSNSWENLSRNLWGIIENDFQFSRFHFFSKFRLKFLFVNDVRKVLFNSYEILFCSCPTTHWSWIKSMFLHLPLMGTRFTSCFHFWFIGQSCSCYKWSYNCL